jgi:hypothetical protein
MSAKALFRRPSGFLPVVLSSAALLLVVAHVATVGVERQADEGAAAHIWQLLMVAQLPVIGYFGIRWVPAAPKAGMLVLLTQVAFALMAALPVFLLKF